MPGLSACTTSLCAFLQRREGISGSTETAGAVPVEKGGCLGLTDEQEAQRNEVPAARLHACGPVVPGLDKLGLTFVDVVQRTICYTGQGATGSHRELPENRGELRQPLFREVGLHDGEDLRYCPADMGHPGGHADRLTRNREAMQDVALIVQAPILRTWAGVKVERRADRPFCG